MHGETCTVCNGGSFVEVDRVLQPENRSSMSLEEQLKDLLEKLDMTIGIKHNSTRSRRAKQLKREINSIRRQLAQQKSLQTDGGHKGSDLIDYSSISEDSSSEDASETASQSDSIPPPQLSPHPAPITGRSYSAQPRSSPYKSPGRGRGRGRGRPRIHRTISEPQPLPENRETSGTVKERPDRTAGKTASPGKSSESANKHSSPDKSTPSGVGRRTAVLFSKKAANRGGSTPRRVGRPPKRAASLDVPPNITPGNSIGGLNVESEFNKNLPASIPEQGATLRKRARSLSYSQDKSKSPTKQQSENELANGFDAKAPSGESFTVYRTEHLTRSSSDSESSVSSHSSGVPTDSSSGEEDRQSRRHRHGVNFTEDSSGDTSCGESTSTNSRFNVRSKAGGPVLRDRERRAKTRSASGASDDEDEDEEIPLNPLDLVWAKCRGYPSYPALIINPKMPRTGCFHNGVPIPVPPVEVLNMKQDAGEHLYLVLFFDNKRTWQWLPRAKLEPLGVDSGLDQAKLTESRKTAVRKSVQIAYDRAMNHQKRVSGPEIKPRGFEEGSEQVENAS